MLHNRVMKRKQSMKLDGQIKDPEATKVDVLSEEDKFRSLLRVTVLLKHQLYNTRSNTNMYYNWHC